MVLGVKQTYTPCEHFRCIVDIVIPDKTGEITTFVMRFVGADEDVPEDVTPEVDALLTAVEADLRKETEGVVIAELDLDRVQLAAGNADPSGIRLYLLEPGQRASLDNLAADTAAQSATGSALLERALADLAADARAAQPSTATFTPRWDALLSSAAPLH